MSKAVKTRHARMIRHGIHVARYAVANYTMLGNIWWLRTQQMNKLEYAAYSRTLSQRAAELSQHKMTVHKGAVVYWVECQCGWERELGVYASVLLIEKAAVGHRLGPLPVDR